MITESRVCYGGVHTRELSVKGSGPPIVLLHGYGDSADTWRGVLARLGTAGRSALAVDLPGFGAADRRSAGPLLPQFDAFADAIVATHGPVVLVGNSLGAATAVRAAGRHPVRSVRALVAVDDPLNVNHVLARLARRYSYDRLFEILSRVPIPVAVLRWAVAVGVRHAMYGPGYGAETEVLDRWISAVPDAAALSELGRDAFRYARETVGGHGNATVDCPTLILHGAKDFIIPVAASRELHRALVGSEFVVLARSGHCPQLDDPTEVARLLVDFLGRVGVLAGKAV